ncbi:hypothetical protein BJ165DRAFT_1315830, partial [Panaeolus papilionaceus]
MQMTLPKGHVTLEATTTKNRTRVDNVFCSEGLQGRLRMCRTREEERAIKTDHIPVETVFDMGVDTVTTRMDFIYRMTDWEKFRSTLKNKLEEIPRPREFRNSQVAAFLQAKGNLEKAIRETTEEVVPKAKEVLWRKRWWSKELAGMRGEVRRLAREALQGNAEVQETYRRKRNDYAQAIRRRKREHWEEWLENLDKRDIWVAGKMVGGSGSD